MAAVRASYFSIRPFLWHAVAATFSVIIAPLALVLLLLAANVTLPMVVIALLGVALAIVATATGAAWWNARPEAGEIGFSDLMLWRWFLRLRAEDTLEEGARLLGLDRSGQPIDDIRITPEQQLEVLKDLTAALESKDPYTHGHSQRVERHVYRTAAAMHLTIQDIEDLRKAAALHDVGKVRVPDRVLRKPEGLTAEERAIMEEHSVVGAWMVSSVGNADVIAAVRHHHERFDGMGYPDGLAGSDIPLYARIIAVADAYDAITSTRPYRASHGREDAVATLRQGSGSQFDPEIVEAFVAALPARLPVTAGLFLILGGAPQRLLRELADWLKRFGAGSLTPAVGAAGAAVVLGASVFTPYTPEPVREQPVAAAPVEEAGSTDVDPLPRRVRERDRTQQYETNNEDAAEDARIVDDIVMGDTLHRELKADDTPKHTEEPVVEERKDEPKRDEREPQPERSNESKKKRNPNDGRDNCADDGNAGGGNDPARCGAASSSGKSRPDKAKSDKPKRPDKPKKPKKLKSDSKFM